MENKNLDKYLAILYVTVQVSIIAIGSSLPILLGDSWLFTIPILIMFILIAGAVHWIILGCTYPFWKVTVGWPFIWSEKAREWMTKEKE